MDITTSIRKRAKQAAEERGEGGARKRFETAPAANPDAPRLGDLRRTGVTGSPDVETRERGLRPLPGSGA